tara:strand:+ start:194 stop:1540 length:1347 start_codon:yes stop_codon:yes gene_type:complete
MKKAQVIEHLIQYFKNDISLFISKVDLNIERYLNCLTSVEVNAIYKSTTNTSVAKTNSPKTTVAKTNSPTTDVSFPLKNEVIMNSNIQPYLPFNSGRPTQDIKERIIQMRKERKIDKRQRNLMILGQLYKNDVINNVKIIRELSLRDDTLIYIGTTIDTKQPVIVKVQPRNKQEYNFKLPNYSYQLSTEASFFNQIKKYNLTTIPAFHFYGNVEPLNSEDIERYILIIELLGNNLTILKNKPIPKIINGVLLAIDTIQSLHSCGMKSTPKHSFVHKDVKHENFVFTDDTLTSVKVIDFGLVESLYDSKNRRKTYKSSYAKKGEGTPLYMSTMQHNLSIHDYMDDLQAFAWMLLDLLGNQPLSTGMPWYNATTNDEKLEMKLEFIARCKDPIYTQRLANGTLTVHNIAIIGELANYTIKTDLKNDDNMYYTEYNEQYYIDIKNIIKKLQ